MLITSLKQTIEIYISIYINLNSAKVLALLRVKNTYPTVICWLIKSRKDL